jgi:hypothetical protein
MNIACTAYALNDVDSVLRAQHVRQIYYMTQVACPMKSWLLVSYNKFVLHAVLIRPEWSLKNAVFHGLAVHALSLLFVLFALSLELARL